MKFLLLAITLSAACNVAEARERNAVHAQARPAAPTEATDAATKAARVDSASARPAAPRVEQNATRTARDAYAVPLLRDARNMR